MLNTINVAASGLAVSREQVENVMNNIANENTPGYKKRVVGVSEASHIDARLTGRGALVGETTRVTNVYVYDNLTSEKSKQSQYSELSVLLEDIESIFYETDNSGLSADLDRYFQALEDLRASPSNEIYKNNLRNAGEIIVDDLKTLYSDIENREIIVKNTINDSVQEANSILNDIGEINNQLLQSSHISNDLLDKRDQLEQELTEYIDIDIDRTNNYELKISDMTAVRFENNIHELNVVSHDIPQKDIYANATEPITSNIINTATWQDVGDKITYKLDNTETVSVTFGEVVTDASGTPVDLDGDGDNTNDAVSSDNAIKAIAYKINNNLDVSGKITAYNGQYVLDSDGNKVLTNNPLHPEYDAADPNKDRYLVIESNIDGDKGQFSGRIIVEDVNAPSSAVEVSKNDILSVKGADDVHVEIFDKELTIKAGKLKPMLENVTTDSGANYFTSYKDMLDNFAAALSDISTSYIENADGTYVYGVKSVDVHDNRTSRVDIGLFTGASVDTLVFNDGVVAGLDQGNLDYLATVQWKTDIDIDGTGTNLTSFSKYNQELRVKVADDKENNDFRKETQDAVTQSLEQNYDKLIKVDKDEEMMNLIKFQASYEANAKLITIIDEMLATILGMRR